VVLPAATLGGAVARVLLVLLLVASWLPASAQESYKYPIDDLTVAINFDFLTRTIQRVVGLHYEADYHSNGEICRTPKIVASLQRLLFVGKTTADLRDGSAKAELTVRAKAEVLETRCRLGGLKTRCTAALSVVGATGTKQSIRVSCRILVLGFPFFAHTRIEIPYPISIPDRYTLKITDPQSSGGFALSFRFGKFQNGSWIALPPPADHVKTFNVGGDALFSPLEPPEITDPPRFEIETTRNLTLSTYTTHSRFYGETRSAQAAFLKHAAGNAFLKKRLALAVIRLRESLLAPRQVSSPGDRRYGILGGLFPLIIEGTYKTPQLPFPIRLRVVLGSLTARFSGENGAPHVSAALSVDEVTITNGETGAELPGKVISGIDLTGPLIDRRGQLYFSAVKLVLTIEADTGTKTIPIPLGPMLRNALNDAMPSVAKMNLQLDLTPPECIPADDKRIEAISACKSFRGEKRKLFSLRERRPISRISLDLKKMSIVGNDGEIVINLPVVP
jgi:hypothetical protein